MKRVLSNSPSWTSVCRSCHRPLPYTLHIRNVTQKKEFGDSSNPLLRYLRSLKWVPIPLGVGFAYIGYQQYGHVVKREKKLLNEATSPEDVIAPNWQVKLYQALPLRVVSRLWGKLHSIHLPEWLRSPVYRLYIWTFNCNLEEAAIRDLVHYKNLGEFFCRRLKPSCRPVDKTYSVTCPSDGKILHFGRVEKGQVEQVKGVTYSLEGFLGPATWLKDVNNNIPGGPSYTTASAADGSAYEKSVKLRDGTDLFHCVIYLAPGDYHGFHSPAHWTVTHRRHFPGELLSVNPGIARWIKGLFVLNERAAYVGQWEHGFFSMTAVGATNVGSIKIYHDKDLATNLPGPIIPGSLYEENFVRPDTSGIILKKGESFGEFNLGSTVVIVFEAPEQFEFKLKKGDKVKFGQPLGSVVQK